MNKIKTLVAASVFLFAGNAYALNFNLSPNNLPSQATFEALSDDLAAATWMNPSNSAEAHSAGLIPVGVQAAIEITGLSVDSNAAHWQAMNISGLSSTLPLPRVRLSAGIPFGLDFSYMILQMPNSNVKMSGYEGRMAFGSFIPLPFIEANFRVYQSSLTGVTDYEIKNQGFGAMIGADLPFVKPYIEIGQVKSTSTPSGNLALVFNEYSKTQTTTALGAKLQLALFVLNLETSKVGDKKLSTVKVGFEF
ncbi:MAG: hypothetical protein AUK35_00500 [Zetaproteobacteria bacterium CG2_30_46_52]|nr:MAG: hypothetical protein AUK35_00500 [Zetaproteobacteria bacterium CG2_30_46_52]